MIPLPGRDEALALRLINIASSLEAGLGADAVLDHPGAAADGLALALAGQERHLAPHEVAILQAAEAAGQLPRALRGRAEARRHRADLVRGVLRRLAYPMLLVASATFVGIITTTLVGTSPWLLISGGVVAVGLIAAAVALPRWVRQPDPRGTRIPGLSGILQDAGEIPYLDAMAGLYGAGVPLVHAHELAVPTVAVGSVRARLFAATSLLSSGEVPWTEALARTGALADETLRILHPAEHAGDLEQAITRAVNRRRETFGRRLTVAVQLLTGTITGLVMLWVAAQVLTFYSGLYGRLGH